jgi:plasmid maintenance system killer protein
MDRATEHAPNIRRVETEPVMSLFSLLNDQWRIAFRWRDGAYEMQIVDYH